MKTDQLWDFLIRGEDKYGFGHFGAQRDGGARQHMGVDLLYAPETILYAWEPMHAVRYAIPYSDDDVLTGIVLRRPDTSDGVVEFKLLYVAPLPGVVPSHIPLGGAFGVVQDLARRYPGISNHTHFECWQHGARVDPTPMIRDFSTEPPKPGSRQEIA